MDLHSLVRRDYSLSILLLLLIYLLPEGAAAQTCRISCGKNHAGVKSYIEVFEYDYVADKPGFPGGDSRLLEFINHNRHYPEDAYRRGIQGRVVCQFVVNADGVVSNVEVVRGVEESLNKEACRILGLMPPWKPGRHEGRAVPVRVIWSVPFRL